MKCGKCNRIFEHDWLGYVSKYEQDEIIICASCHLKEVSKPEEVLK